MPLTAILVAFGAFASALAGGVLALRAARSGGPHHRGRRRHPHRGRLLRPHPRGGRPHARRLDAAMIATAVGFLAFYAIEKMTTLHVGHETATELEHGASAHRHIGIIGASGMSLHSFLDGVALAAGAAVGGGLGW